MCNIVVLLTVRVVMPCIAAAMPLPSDDEYSTTRAAPVWDIALSRQITHSAGAPPTHSLSRAREVRTGFFPSSRTGGNRRGSRGLARIRRLRRHRLLLSVGGRRRRWTPQRRSLLSPSRSGGALSRGDHHDRICAITMTDASSTGRPRTSPFSIWYCLPTTRARVPQFGNWRAAEQRLLCAFAVPGRHRHLELCRFLALTSCVHGDPEALRGRALPPRSHRGWHRISS